MGFDGVHAAFRFDAEHLLGKLRRVAGLFPERVVHQLWRADFLVVMRTLLFLHVVLDGLVQHPALRMPERHTRGFFLKVE